MFFGGCDVGSTTGKAVILNNTKILAAALIPATTDPEQTARTALENALAQIPDLPRLEDLEVLVGTGYGRVEVPFATTNISEITCHGVGANFLLPSVRTVIDIGGQDLKAIALRDNGKVLEFAMNDRCAAGTGRFFEAMARAFNVDLDTFATLSRGATTVIPISSQCSVFAETEVISLVAQKKPVADIVAGIENAVAKRVFALTRRVGVRDDVVITGGCAKNAGLMQVLSKKLSVTVKALDMDPQLVGALGAAILARQHKNVH